MHKYYKNIAFDLGGVLAYLDWDVLNESEKMILKSYFKRNDLAELERIASDLGIGVRDLLASVNRHITDIYRRAYKLNRYTIEAFQMLKDSGIEPAIWTNNTNLLGDWIEQEGLHRFVLQRNVCNSFYLGSDKPNPKFFEKALVQMRSVKDDVLFIDDDEKNITSAKVFGIDVEQYDMFESEESLKDIIGKKLKGK